MIRLRRRHLTLLGIGLVCVVFAAFAPKYWLSLSRERTDGRIAKNFTFIGIALHEYCEANGHLPPAYIADENGKPKMAIAADRLINALFWRRSRGQFS